MRFRVSVKELCRAQSLMKLANKKGNEVGPEVVDEIEIKQVNVVSNTQLKVCQATLSLEMCVCLSSL